MFTEDNDDVDIEDADDDNGDDDFWEIVVSLNLYFQTKNDTCATFWCLIVYGIYLKKFKIKGYIL